jgi:hypothetical protein
MPARLSLMLALVLGLYISISLPARADGTKSFIGHLPQRLAAFTAGTAIGTPIAVVRCTKRELVKQTKDAYKLGGVRPKALGYVSAAFFGIPSGLLSGAVCGVSDGVADSWASSKDEPFGRKSFSLDKLEY